MSALRLAAAEAAAEDWNEALKARRKKKGEKNGNKPSLPHARRPQQG